MDVLEKICIQLAAEMPINRTAAELNDLGYEVAGTGFRRIVDGIACYYRLSDDHRKIEFDSIRAIDVAHNDLCDLDDYDVRRGD